MPKILPVPKVLPSGKVVKKTKASRRSRNVASTAAAQFTREERDEMRRLSSMLPVAARTEKYEQDPSMLLNDTVCYINHLMATVHARVAAGSLPREVLAQLDPRYAASESPSSSTSTSPATSPTPVRREKKRRSSKH
ncbi:hypothetical protein PRIPAC_82396 [Pristionchus pacificus]|uniref:Uncharacterized protein n=1 Tax=Pristionchus pacificus TaxID=54126 RepID=A0A2A6BXV2_PRIPA|nr:hypothetical protein PRIPAC_82396 [Pristionchus pacificus]|eukprot:PDM70735.1 hypothetical protein PRIPAC_44939 [Pristionchus pacificus]